MTNIDRCDKLAALTFRIKCGVGLLDVISECMRCCRSETDAYGPAMYAVSEYFGGIAETMQEFQEAELAEPDDASEAVREFSG